MPATIERFRYAIKGLLPYYRRRYCPICQTWDRRFDPNGQPPRPEARCTRCWSLERHRLVWLFLRTHSLLFSHAPRSMLHFAPEVFFVDRLANLPNLDYITTDLLDENVMVQADITDLPFDDGRFDIVYCSHVLEHVPDDRQAMRECLRVLRPGGQAVFMVPLTAPATIEDPHVTDPAERLRLFGQSDHVRRYGPDFAERLQEAGYEVTAYTARDLTHGKPERYAVMTDEVIFSCRREASPHRLAA